MAYNAAGLDVRGSKNPRWKGGRIDKTCSVCGVAYSVARPQAASKYCSRRCCGLGQRGLDSRGRRDRVAASGMRLVSKPCEVCGGPISLPECHIDTVYCCSRKCGGIRRSRLQSGPGNPNWNGGLSREPYPYDFAKISGEIIERDGGRCQGRDCRGRDRRLTTHHIDYDKKNGSPDNLIALCSSCNSRANFGRQAWTAYYRAVLERRGIRAGGKR